MARANRVVVEDGRYHLTTRIANQAHYLEDPAVKDLIVTWIYGIADFAGIEVLSWNILDNRLHIQVHVPCVPEKLMLPGADPTPSAFTMRPAECRQPRWEDLKANIVLVEQKAVDELPPLHPSWQQTLFFWHFIFSARERAVLFIIFNLLFWSLLVANKIRRHEMTSVAIALSLALTLATGSSLAKELFFKFLKTIKSIISNPFIFIFNF